MFFFFFSSRRRHTRCSRDWSSDVCSSDLLTLTADPQTKAYGAPLPSPLTATVSGFVLGQTLATSGVTGIASCTTTATPCSTVPFSPYPITCTQGTLTADNYDFTNFVPGNLTVNPALLTITADNKVKTYGGPLPALTVSYSGLVNGDTPATFSGAPNTAPTIATTATTTSHVGTYGITASAAADADYTISYAAGTLTVNPALLTDREGDE